MIIRLSHRRCYVLNERKECWSSWVNSQRGCLTDVMFFILINIKRWSQESLKKRSSHENCPTNIHFAKTWSWKGVWDVQKWGKRKSKSGVEDKTRRLHASSALIVLIIIPFDLFSTVVTPPVLSWLNWRSKLLHVWVLNLSVVSQAWCLSIHLVSHALSTSWHEHHNNSRRKQVHKLNLGESSTCEFHVSRWEQRPRMQETLGSETSLTTTLKASGSIKYIKCMANWRAWRETTSNLISLNWKPLNWLKSLQEVINEVLKPKETSRKCYAHSIADETLIELDIYITTVILEVTPVVRYEKTVSHSIQIEKDIMVLLIMSIMRWRSCDTCLYDCLGSFMSRWRQFLRMKT